MSALQKFTDANFQSEVLESDQPVLVDFWAAWCGPCRAIGPIIEELANEYEGTVKVGKLDIDENPQAPSNFRVSSIPAVLLLKDGEVVESFIGVQPKERYVAAIQKTFASASA
jgi:thioredoxin 1